MFGKWVGYYKAARKSKALTDGYDWAAGQILRGEKTPAQIRGYALDNSHPFDQGVIEAIETLVNLGVTDEGDY